jgi:hypothetical protein
MTRMTMMRRSRYLDGMRGRKKQKEGERQSTVCVLALPTMDESNVSTARGFKFLNNPSGSHAIRVRSAVDKKAMQCIRKSNNQAVNLLLLSSSLVLKNDNSLCIFG